MCAKAKHPTYADALSGDSLPESVWVNEMLSIHIELTHRQCTESSH